MTSHTVNRRGHIEELFIEDHAINVERIYLYMLSIDIFVCIHFIIIYQSELLGEVMVISNYESVICNKKFS